MLLTWLAVALMALAGLPTPEGLAARDSHPRVLTARYCQAPPRDRTVASPGAPSVGNCLIRLGPPHSLLGGYNEDWTLRLSSIPLAAGGGARLLRFPADWGLVQAGGPTSWDWSLLDQIHSRAAANGMRLIFEAYGSPCWAHPSLGCPGRFGGSPPDAGYLDQWGAFIAAAASRYPDLAAIEIWNEPNAQPFWSIRPDPEGYAALLAAAHRALRGVPSAPPLLFGGLSMAAVDGPAQICFRCFLARALESGAAGNFDAFAIHPYAFPFNRSDYLASTRKLLGMARLVLARHGEGGVPFWVTEVGFSTAGVGAVSPDEQATRLGRVWRLLARVPGVEAVVVHRFYDQPAGEGWESGWGVVDGDGSPKPAFGLLADLFRGGSAEPGKPCRNAVPVVTRAAARCASASRTRRGR